MGNSTDRVEDAKQHFLGNDDVTHDYSGGNPAALHDDIENDRVENAKNDFLKHPERGDVTMDNSQSHDKEGNNDASSVAWPGLVNGERPVGKPDSTGSIPTIPDSQET